MATGFAEEGKIPLFDPEPGTSSGAGMRPFSSTGPHGHRGRMRDKLLAAGPDALADYEILEMLLFFGIPRRDTKPLAKSVINHFGDLAKTLAATPFDLRTGGLNTASIAALKLVEQSASRLAKAEIRERPLLNDWDKLSDYLATSLADAVTGPGAASDHCRILFLNNRNQLLSDEPPETGLYVSGFPRDTVKRALELHATALIIVQSRPGGALAPSKEDVAVTKHLAKASSLLSIVVHDHLIMGDGRFTSLRKKGLL